MGKRVLDQKKNDDEQHCAEEGHQIKMKIHRLTELKIKRDLGLLLDEPPPL